MVLWWQASGFPAIQYCWILLKLLSAVLLTASLVGSVIVEHSPCHFRNLRHADEAASDTEGFLAQYVAKSNQPPSTPTSPCKSFIQLRAFAEY